MGGNAEVPLKGTSMVQRKPAGARIVDKQSHTFPPTHLHCGHEGGGHRVQRPIGVYDCEIVKIAKSQD